MRHWRVWLLAGVWSMIYGPYVVRGGLVRDDLGFVSVPRMFATYWDFQAWVSSEVTMTARPVSALLHGLCYWFLGTSAWAFHLINLSLFLGSVLLVYLAVRNVLSERIAFATAALALVYPSATGTAFSSILMNANLAGLCWAAALFLVSRRAPRGSTRRADAGAALLLLLSALSYEAFIPLFLANVLLAFVQRRGRAWRPRALSSVWPLGLTLALLALYRGVLEQVIFRTRFSRIQAPMAGRPWDAALRAMTQCGDVAFVDSLDLSLRAVARVGEMAPWQLAALALGVAGAGVVLLRDVARGDHPAAVSAGVRFVDDADDRRSPRYGEPPLLGALVAAGVLFAAATSIFVLSDYEPTAKAFESRTQAGIRFAWAFLVAVGVVWVSQLLGPLWRRLCALGLVVLVALSALSVSVQRQAWIAADRFNHVLLQRMDAAIRASGLAGRDSFSLMAELPLTFPGQFNAEPAFGEFWDLGPALSLRYPEKQIWATVYYSDRPGVEWGGGTDRSGRARPRSAADAPFYLYRYATDRIYRIEDGRDLAAALGGR